MKQSFLALAVAVALAGFSTVVAQDAKLNGEMNPTDAQFVREALASGHHEVEMGQMAMKQSMDPQVKSLAQRLVNDHTAANKKLEAIGGVASQAPSTVPATTAALKADINNRENEAAITQNANSIGQPAGASGQSNTRAGASSTIRKDSITNESTHVNNRFETMTGATFDKEWAQQMIEDHQAAITKFESAQKDVKNAGLQAFISTTLPTLKEHLAQAQALNK